MAHRLTPWARAPQDGCSLDAMTFYSETTTLAGPSTGARTPTGPTPSGWFLAASGYASLNGRCDRPSLVAVAWWLTIRNHHCLRGTRRCATHHDESGPRACQDELMDDDQRVLADLIDDVDDDEEPVELRDVTSAFVTDTDWTSETILSQMRRGNIQLNPRFQRRDAWDRSRKSRFVESLILGLPIPQLVLAEDKRRKGSFIVLDGKQRLLTLAQFAKESSLDSDADGSLVRLQLGSLEVRPELQRLSLRDLESRADRVDDLNSFLNQTIRTVVVRNWPDDDFLNLVFLRLNTGSVKLSPQELRQALHPGLFTDFLDDHASASEPLQQALNITGPDFRMRDVEILLRFYALRTALSSYRGSLKRFLDDTSDRLNAQWESDEARVRMLASEFDQAVAATITIFGGNAFTRWNSDRHAYENRFNRAVFDIMVYYFSSPDTRDAALGAPGDVEQVFRSLSERNPTFVEAMQTSTKTIEALFTRLSVWGGGLASVIGLNLDVPTLDAARVLHP